MNRLLAIFFLFTFLSANTAFGEVLKLPLLVHHYFEHTQEDKSETIFDFLVQHYSGNINHHHHNKDTEHDHLPFKTLNSHATQVISIIPQPILSVSQLIYELDDVKISSHNQQNYSNAYLKSIWQPPRFC